MTAASAASDPIRFRGMDVWDRPWEHHARIEALAVPAGVDRGIARRVRENCPVSGASSWAEVEALLPYLAGGGAQAGLDHGRCRDALTALLDRARDLGRRARAEGRPAADGAFEVALSASTLLGWLGFHHYSVTDDLASWNERDRAQGRNLALILEQHGAARAMLSAHTSHVSHNRSPANWWGSGDLKSGVFFFQALTGRKVFNVALTAYEASGTQGEWLLPTAANSMDRKLHEAGHRFAFFAADAAFLAEYPRWWLQNGNALGMENGIELTPRDHFDAYFFFGRSPLDRALPARPMWQP